MEHYTSLPFRPLTSQHCDVTIDKPVMFMKLDAGRNLITTDITQFLGTGLCLHGVIDRITSVATLAIIVSVV